MPILIFLLLVLLIAQVGFWDTLGAVLGAAAMMLVFVLLVAAFLGAAGYYFLNRFRRRF